MLNRCSSSRRPRASRNIEISGHPVDGSSTVATTGRRASVATESPNLFVHNQTNLYSSMEKKQISPRGSIVPNIALDANNDLPEKRPTGRRLPNPDFATSRNNLSTEIGRSPHNTLVPDDFCRSHRGSLVSDISRNPTNSLAPDTPHTSRHSLLLDVAYNRSPRNSTVQIDSRTLLLGENGTINFNRSPRHSLIPDTNRSPRGSVANLELDRSPRGSVCPEIIRNLRSVGISVDSTIPLKNNRSPRGSISSINDSANQSPRGSITIDPNRSPRGSIGADRRSLRGSICSNRGPRESMIEQQIELTNRSPRGSIVVNGLEKYSKNIVKNNEDENRIPSPEGKIRSRKSSADIERSPKSSINVALDVKTVNNNLELQNVRRTSANEGIARSRSASPYRHKDRNHHGSTKSAGNSTYVNLTYGEILWTESKKSSNSQDSPKLLSKEVDKTTEKNLENPRVPDYGSVIYQLKDAYFDAENICDFVLRSLKIFSKTAIVTACLALLSILPILMLILGLQFVKECPREPRIPIYMIVSGFFGTVRIFWTLHTQVHSKKYQTSRNNNEASAVSPLKLLSILLSCFLFGWFIIGNYWILSIEWPEYNQPLQSSIYSDRWCNKSIYLSSLAHICITYVIMATILLIALGLTFFRALCPWPERYK